MNVRELEVYISSNSPNNIILSILEETHRALYLLDSRVSSHHSVFGKLLKTYDLGADPHITGAPILLEMEKGLFVYKPRPVNLDYSYNELIKLLTDYGLKFPPQILKVYRFPRYGFISFINHQPAPIHINELHFRSVGSVLCIVYALAGTDFHYDNMLFTEENVYLVDLEGLLQPALIKKSPSQSDHLSVLNTGILPTRVVAGRNIDFDPSFLSAKRYDVSCDLNSALSAMLEGFADTYQIILKYRDKIRSSDTYNSFQETRSRFFPSNTVDYYRAMVRHIDSISTEVNSTPYLDTLKSTHGHDDPYLPHEKKALSQLCIPVFFSTNNQRSILTEMDDVLDVPIEKSGFEASRSRIDKAFSNEDLRRQAWFISCSFELHASNVDEIFSPSTKNILNIEFEQQSIVNFLYEIAFSINALIKISNDDKIFAVVPVFDSGKWVLHNRLLKKEKVKSFLILMI